MDHDPLASLDRLARTLGELDALPRKLAVAVAPAITKELRAEFARGCDPYGRKWRKLATGKPSYLTKSKKLRKGTRAAPMPGNRTGVRVILGAKYAVFHQTGTGRMPARKILPERGMPASWRVAIDREARRIAKAAA